MCRPDNISLVIPKWYSVRDNKPLHCTKMVQGNHKALYQNGIAKMKSMIMYYASRCKQMQADASRCGQVTFPNGIDIMKGLYMNLMQCVWNTKEELDGMVEQRKQVWLSAVNITSSYSHQRIQSARDTHKFDKLVILDDRISRKYDYLLMLQMELFKWMYECDELESVDRQIVLRRYFMFETWQQIANKADYSVIQIRRIHKRICALAPEVDMHERGGETDDD